VKTGRDHIFFFWMVAPIALALMLMPLIEFIRRLLN